MTIHSACAIDFTFTVSPLPYNGGTFDVTNGLYLADTNLVITATPGTGFAFISWTGDVPASNQTDNPLTLALSTNKTIVGNFEFDEVTLFTFVEAVNSNTVLNISQPVILSNMQNIIVGDASGMSNFPASVTNGTIASYGQIFSSNAIGLSMNVVTTYTLITNLSVGIQSGGTLVTGTTSSIVIGSTGGGIYDVTASISHSPPTQLKNEDVRYAFHINGSAQENASNEDRLSGNASLPSGLPVTGRLSLSPSDVVDLRAFLVDPSASVPSVINFPRINIRITRIDE